MLGRARTCWADGTYRDTRHAIGRRQRRIISVLEVGQIVETGFREPSKDEYKEQWRAWNYAIRGKTLDGRSLRVAVSFDEAGFLLVITAMDLGS